MLNGSGNAGRSGSSRHRRDPSPRRAVAHSSSIRAMRSRLRPPLRVSTTRLRTHPATSSASAISRGNQRKPTPCTRPVTTMGIRSRAVSVYARPFAPTLVPDERHESHRGLRCASHRRCLFRSANMSRCSSRPSDRDEQPPALGQLLEQRLRDVGRAPRPRESRRTARTPAIRTSRRRAGARCVRASLCLMTSRALSSSGRIRSTENTCAARCDEQHGLVARPRADLQHALVPRRCRSLEISCVHRRLRDRLPVPDRKRRVVVRAVPNPARNEQVPRRQLERAQHRQDRACPSRASRRRAARARRGAGLPAAYGACHQVSRRRRAARDA